VEFKACGTLFSIAHCSLGQDARVHSARKIEFNRRNKPTRQLRSHPLDSHSDLNRRRDDTHRWKHASTELSPQREKNQDKEREAQHPWETNCSIETCGNRDQRKQHRKQGRPRTNHHQHSHATAYRKDISRQWRHRRRARSSRRFIQTSAAVSFRRSRRRNCGISLLHITRCVLCCAAKAPTSHKSQQPPS
jgi:hypothetical protein